MSIGLGSILRFVAARFGLGTITGPVPIQVTGGRVQYWMRFEEGNRESVTVYGEALPFHAAKASVYLYALREFELMGVLIKDLYYNDYVARLENI